MAVQQLHSPGGQTILSCTAATTGDWFRVNPKLGKLAFQVVHTGSSVGASISSSSVIQVSNDGVTPLATVAGTIGISGDTPAGGALSDGFATDTHWEYVRAVVQTCSAASAASAGTALNVSVKVSAQMRS